MKTIIILLSLFFATNIIVAQSYTKLDSIYKKSKRVVLVEIEELGFPCSSELWVESQSIICKPIHIYKGFISTEKNKFAFSYDHPDTTQLHLEKGEKYVVFLIGKNGSTTIKGKHYKTYEETDYRFLPIKYTDKINDYLISKRSWKKKIVTKNQLANLKK